MENKNEIYDVLIIGAGPAGLSAALYAARALLKTLVLEKTGIGGLITQTDEIENYPGGDAASTGLSLTQRMYEQAQQAGAVFSYDEISAIRREGDIFVLSGTVAENYFAKSVIIAAGSLPKLLGIEGETEFRGRGVSYCATCDAGFFMNKTVAVVGGGDTAVKEAIYLTKYVAKVLLFHRRDKLRAAADLQRKLCDNEKIEIIYNAVPESIFGSTKTEGIRIKDKLTGKVTDYATDGVFIFAGYLPNTEFCRDAIELDPEGYIVADDNMHTSAAGIFAAGDIRQKTLRQVITAAADGAVAAVEAEKYLQKESNRP